MRLRSILKDVVWVVRLLALSFVTCLEAAELPVDFADVKLKTAIEDELWIDDPTPTDMLDLIALRCVGQGIESISGLEYALNINSLNLRYNHVDDVSPLAYCTQLEFLNLSENLILSDVTPLAGLTALKNLDCHANQITDLSFTTGLTNLERLVLRSNGLTDVSKIAHLTNLTELRIEWNQIRDITSLVNLVGLRLLDLSGNQITDLSALENMINMQFLILYDNPISELSPLFRMNKVNHLFLKDCRVRDISVLCDMKQLTYLCLSGNPLGNDAYLYHLNTIRENRPSMQLEYSPNSRSPGGFQIVEQDGIDRIQLSWEPVANGPDYTSYYRVYRRSDSDLYEIPISLWQTELTYEDGSLQMGETYRYRVQCSISEEGASPGGSSQISIKVNPGIGISSSAGGYVLVPGEGRYEYPESAIIPIAAFPVDPCLFVFDHWSGSGVDAGKVIDPNAALTEITVDGLYSLKANFVSTLETLYVSADANSAMPPLGTLEAPIRFIQDAIDMSRPGGEVRVSPGTYRESLDFRGKALHLNGLDANEPLPPIYNRDRSVALFFHGELFNPTSGLSDPEYILMRYIKFGEKCLHEVEGIFHFFIFDGRKRTILLFSDPFGLLPIYYTQTKNSLIFSGEVKALLQDDTVTRLPDFESIGDFFHFGQILGQKTLLRGVKLLAPASFLMFSMDECKLELKKYWHMESLFVEHGGYSNILTPSDAVDLLIEAIQKNSDSSERLGLSLSGGLDSRVILAGLQRKTKGLSTYTLGLEGCADQKLADQMAGVAKTNHEFIVLDQQYIENFEEMVKQMIMLSDGMYHPHESTEMLALAYFKNARFKILLRGHGGEIAKAGLAYPVMVRPEVFSIKDSSSILDYIFRQTNLVLRDIDRKRLFLPSYRDILTETPGISLRNSCLEASQNFAPADVCIYYYINEHIRRQVVASLDIFRSEVEIRMPFVSMSFLKVLLALPIAERYSGEIHHKLVKKCMPELLKIRNSNTGAPMDAGDVRLFLTDKFNAIMKKMNFKGFRHYTQFQDWYRQGFREKNESIILGERIAARNIYDMDYLRKIYKNHVDGKKDYGHFIGTLIGIEMWFRLFVDQEKS